MATLYELVPHFDYIEPNNLKGLQPGFVVAQMPIATAAVSALTVTKGTKKFMQNGVICDISKNGIVAPSMSSKNLFIHFSEPLNRLVDADDCYACDISEEHPRLVQLIPGDEWMGTAALDLASKVVSGSETNPLYGRIVEITSTDGMYAADDFLAYSKMADGKTGHHYMYIG